MAREMQEPTVNEHGAEQHPSWCLIGASRVSATPGAVLFDSEIRHQHYVIIRLTRADRRRDLNRDWLHGTQQLVEVAMSQAQWAEFVSSMNQGQGTACTLTYEGVQQVPEFPYAPRMAESMAEVRGAADEALEGIREAFAKVKDKPNKGNIQHLEWAIKNAPSNMAFAAKSLAEHTETVVAKAKADLEAMVVAKADQLGLDRADLGVTLELEAGGDGDA